MLEVKNLSLNIRNTQLLQNISFTMHEGQHWLLCGANGSGKTLLIESICNLHHTTGSVLWCGSPISDILAKQRTALALQGQRTAIPRTLRVQEIITLYHKLYPNEERIHAYAKWAELINTRCANKRFSKLSSGERKLIHIYTTFISNAELLIFDEPTAHLDSGCRQLFWQMYTRESRMMLVVTHADHDISTLPNSSIAIVIRGKLIVLPLQFDTDSPHARYTVAFIEKGEYENQMLSEQSNNTQIVLPVGDMLCIIGKSSSEIPEALRQQAETLSLHSLLNILINWSS